MGYTNFLDLDEVYEFAVYMAKGMFILYYRFQFREWVIYSSVHITIFRVDAKNLEFKNLINRAIILTCWKSFNLIIF